MPHRSDFTPGEICWVDLNAHDLEAATQWYGELFGWTHEIMPSTHEGAPPYAFFLKDGAVAAGIGQMSEEMKAIGIPPLWNCYVMSEDCAATEAKAKELGAQITVPTMDVPGHGKLAFFMDPSGASLAAWQNTRDVQQPMLVHEHGGMCWGELMTPDAAGAKDFYASLFGWDTVSMEMPGMGGEPIEYTMFKNDGKDAAGMMQMDGPQWEGVPPHWMLYFAVDDCAAIAERIGASGGTIVVPPSEIPVGIFSVAKDPQGGTFSVIQATQAPC